MSWLSNLFGGRRRKARAVELPPRKELEQRHLADLHSYASTLGIKRYRLLRRGELIDTLLERSGTSNGRRPQAAVEKKKEAAKEAARPKKAAREDGSRRSKDEDTYAVTGVLDVTRRGHGFLRVHGFVKSTEDPYVARSQIRKLELRSGDEVGAQARRPTGSERYPSVVRIESVEGEAPQQGRAPQLEDQPTGTSRRLLPLTRGPDDVGGRMLALVAPIGVGQRALITAPPGAGATTLLQGLARSLAAQPNMALFVVLVGAGPQELADWRDVDSGEVHASQAEDSPPTQIGVAELAVERAKRAAERGGDAVVLLDSGTRLANARASARSRSGESGADAARLVERLFGSARATRQGGSLTIVTTVSVSAQDGRERELHAALVELADVEMVLDAGLAREGLYPAIDATASSARLDEELLGERERQRLTALRSVIRSLEPREAWEFLSEKLGETDSNEQLLLS